MEFWEVLVDGVNAAAKEFGVEAFVRGPQKEIDVDTQIAILEQTIKEKPDAIVLAAADYKRLVPAVEAAHKAGIPLITVDSGVDSDVIRSSIATDNIAAGRKLGQAVVDLSGGRAKVAIISFVQNATTQLDRERGVREVLEALPGIELIGTHYSDGFVEKAYELTKQLLTEHDDLTAIVGLNEPSTVGAGRAIKELGLGGQVILVGFDSSLDEVKLLEEGIMQVTVVQRPFNMGYLGIKTALQVIRGDKVERQIDTGSVVINRANMYEEEHQKLLFPFVED